MKLSDQPRYTWHRLGAHPDRLDHAGPTSFYASWSISLGVLSVLTKDSMDSPSYRVSDPYRVAEYLATETV